MGELVGISPALLLKLAIEVVKSTDRLPLVLSRSVVEFLTRPRIPTFELRVAKQSLTSSRDTLCCIHGCVKPRHVGLLCQKCSHAAIKADYPSIDALQPGTYHELFSQLKQKIERAKVVTWKRVAAQWGIKSIDGVRSFMSETGMSPQAIALIKFFHEESQSPTNMAQYSRVRGASAWAETTVAKRFIDRVSACNEEFLVNLALFGIVRYDRKDSFYMGLPKLRELSLSDFGARIGPGGLMIFAAHDDPSMHCVVDTLMCAALLEVSGRISPNSYAVWVSYSAPPSGDEDGAVVVNGSTAMRTKWLDYSEGRRSQRLHVGLAPVLTPQALIRILHAGFGSIIFHGPPPNATLASGCVHGKSGFPWSTFVWTFLIFMATSKEFPGVQLDEEGAKSPAAIQPGLAKAILSNRKTCQAKGCDQCKPNFVDRACIDAQKNGVLTLSDAVEKGAPPCSYHIGPYARIQIGNKEEQTRKSVQAALVACQEWKAILLGSIDTHVVYTRGIVPEAGDVANETINFVHERDAKRVRLAVGE